ncbi:MAG: polysaccharide deacetylase family protein [Deltaproteobacteria bacterium]|nr:polysaccharide deacetylase family protein [Deltaproteobacteria bacterium]
MKKCYQSLQTPPLLDIARGDIEKKELSLTFDGGAEDGAAKEILEILRKKSIKTTIFLTGEFIKKYPELVKDMAQDGHEIGNHTFSHPHLTTYEKDFKHMTLQEVDKEFLSNELKETAALFKEATGKEMSHLWRAPYGEINKEILAWAFEAGYIHISWTTDKKKRQSLDSLDWVKDEDSTLYLTADEIKEKIINFDKNGNGVNGGIVLMHLGTERQTQEAHKKLEDIIDTLSSQGYRFVKVSQMLVKNQSR